MSKDGFEDFIENYFVMENSRCYEGFDKLIGSSSYVNFYHGSILVSMELSEITMSYYFVDCWEVRIHFPNLFSRYSIPSANSGNSMAAAACAGIFLQTLWPLIMNAAACVLRGLRYEQ